jgi:hypothetical protein
MMVSGVAQIETRPTRAHLAEHELLSFLRGELCCAARRRVVRHLLAGCPECRAIGRSLWALGDRPLIPLAVLRRKAW